jgi:hypothetical protein
LDNGAVNVCHPFYVELPYKLSIRRISYGESPQKSGLARKALLTFSTDTRFKMKLYLPEFNISSIHFASLKLNF